MSPAVAMIEAGTFLGVPLPEGLVLGAGLFLARTSTMLLFMPLIGTGASFHGYKVTLVVSIASVMFAAQGLPSVLVDSWIHYGLLMTREMIIGAGLAFLFHLVVMGIRVGSEMVGNEMAFTMANSVDPASGESMPLLSRMNETLFFLAFLGVNGHHWVVRALAESYERAPVGALSFGGSAVDVITRFFADLFSAGIAFAAPIVVLLLMISLLLGLIARSVPQVNVLEMGFSLRVGGGLAAVGLLAPTLAPAMTTMLDHFMAALEAGLDALEG